MKLVGHVACFQDVHVYTSIFFIESEHFGHLGIHKKKTFRWILKYCASLKIRFINQGRVQCWVLLNVVLNIWDPYRAGNFWNSWATISLSRLILVSSLISEANIVRKSVMPSFLHDWVCTVAQIIQRRSLLEIIGAECDGRPKVGGGGQFATHSNKKHNEKNLKSWCPTDVRTTNLKNVIQTHEPRNKIVRWRWTKLYVMRD